MYFSLFKGKLLAGRFLKPKGCICFLQVPLILKVFVMTLLSKPGLITFSQFFCLLKTSYFATVQYVLKDKFSKQVYAYIPPPDKLSSTSPLISTVKTSKWSISTSCCRELPHMLHNYSDWQLHLILGPVEQQYERIRYPPANLHQIQCQVCDTCAAAHIRPSSHIHLVCYLEYTCTPVQRSNSISDPAPTASEVSSWNNDHH